MNMNCIKPKREANNMNDLFYERKNIKAIDDGTGIVIVLSGTLIKRLLVCNNLEQQRQILIRELNRKPYVHEMLSVARILDRWENKKGGK